MSSQHILPRRTYFLVFWLMILLGMTMTDYVSRMWSAVR